MEKVVYCCNISIFSFIWRNVHEILISISSSIKSEDIWTKSKIENVQMAHVVMNLIMYTYCYIVTDSSFSPRADPFSLNKTFLKFMFISFNKSNFIFVPPCIFQAIDQWLEAMECLEFYSMPQCLNYSFWKLSNTDLLQNP